MVNPGNFGVIEFVMIGLFFLFVAVTFYIVKKLFK